MAALTGSVMSRCVADQQRTNGGVGREKKIEESARGTNEHKALPLCPVEHGSVSEK
jgi:hypothetical protein